MDKEKRIKELLQEKRISYNEDANDLEGNRVRGLYELIQDWFKPDFVVVEIGSCEGSSTELFALTCKQVYAIDPWEGSLRPNAQIEMIMSRQSEHKCRKRMIEYDNVKIIKGLSEVEVKNFEDKSIDAVYIDGAHDTESVVRDIGIWLPKIKDGGIMCGHDYSTSFIEQIVVNRFGFADKTYKDSSWAVDLGRFFKKA